MFIFNIVPDTNANVTCEQGLNSCPHNSIASAIFIATNGIQCEGPYGAIATTTLNPTHSISCDK